MSWNPCIFTRYLSTLHSVNDVTEGITQESPMGDSWAIPRKVDKMVWISTQWVLPTTRQDRAGIVVGITQESPIVFSSQSVVSLPCLVNSRRNHPSLTINLESGTHTKLATLLGSTHGWFLGDSFCDIINGAKCRSGNLKNITFWASQQTFGPFCFVRALRDATLTCTLHVL